MRGIANYRNGKAFLGSAFLLMVIFVAAALPAYASPLWMIWMPLSARPGQSTMSRVWP
jgi:hypothetical protein